MRSVFLGCIVSHAVTRPADAEPKGNDTFPRIVSDAGRCRLINLCPNERAIVLLRASYLTYGVR